MKYIYALFIFTAITVNAKAQYNFKPGYVINLKGDTLRGEINYKGWASNPKTILFRSGAGTGTIEYGVSNSTGFGVDRQESYSRHRVKISTDHVDISDLPIGIDSSFVEEDVFLQKVITHPKISLFSYRDKLKTRYYIADEKTSPYELEYRVYKKIDDTREVNYQYKFRTQLLIAATKSGLLTEAVKLDISKARYRSSDIIKIISDLDGIDQTTEEERTKSVGRFFMGLALNKTTLKYEGINDLLIAPNSVNTPSYMPSLVFGYDRIVDQSVGDLIVRLDLTLSAANTKLFFDHNDPAGDHFIVNSSVKQYIVSFAPQLLYNFYNTPALKFYVNGGLSGSYSTYTYQYRRQSKGGLYQTDQYPQLESLWLAFPVRVGAELNNKVAIYTGYQFPVSIGSRAGYSANIQTLSIGVNYLFNKSK